MGEHLWRSGKRRCYACKNIKEIEKFRKHRRGSQGRDYICSECSFNRFKSTKAYIPKYYARFLRKKIITETNYTCQKCGFHYENYTFFDIDHIKPKILREKRRPLRKRDILNYQVLCPNCHRIKTINDGSFLLSI